MIGYNPAKPPKWFSGGGGLLSTAEDYARFCQMLLNGGELNGVRILSRKSVELMTSNHLPPDIGYGAFTMELGLTAPTTLHPRPKPVRPARAPVARRRPERWDSSAERTEVCHSSFAAVLAVSER